MASRQQSANRAARGIGTALSTDDGDVYEPAPIVMAREVRAVRTASPTPAQPGSRTSMLLEGLKDELFELEVEHKQGRISQQEYEKTKAALDQTLQRALRRDSARQT